MSDANLARLVVSLEAKIDNFEKSLDKARRATYAAAGDIKKSLDEVDGRWGKLFGHSEPGKALDNVFSRSRLAVIEEGAAKIPLFGSAIEALGPVGFAAAAGIGALALTMERTEKAVEFAASLGKLAQVVGVSTDFIQQFNFAASQSEVDVGKADEALKNLNASLGLVQSGLARKQLANAFKAAGFTPEQLRQFHDVSDFLPVLIQHLSATGDAAEQAAIARRLGIEELLPMLKEGAGGFEELANKARELGVVMDGSTIRQAEEAKKKLNELDLVMKTQANITFAEFSGTLVTIKEGFLNAEKAALSFLAAVTGTTPAAQRLTDLNRQIRDLEGRHGGALEPAEKTLYDNLVAQRAVVQMHAGIQDLMNPATPPAADGAVKALVTASGGKAKKPKKPPTYSLGSDFLETPFDPLTGEAIKAKSPQEQWKEAMFGDGAKPVKIDADVSLHPTLNEEWTKRQKEMSDGVHSAWSQGLNAALNGNFFAYIKQKLMSSALEGLADALTKATMEAAGNSAFVHSALAFLGLPGFAGGTDYAPGGMAWVGENGPELLNLPKGSQVVPSHVLANGVRGGGGTVYQIFNLDGAVTTDALMAHIDAVSTQKAMGAVGTAKTETLKSLAVARANRMGR